jgi:hypothetical protein
VEANVKCKIFRLLFSLLALLLVAFPARTPAQAGDTMGTIAYITRGGANGDEIHLIEPDGSGERLLFQTNHNLQGTLLLDISNLAWKPDASELAFSSGHEYTCSLFETDIYTIRPDGTNYRRVSDPPACAQRAGLPTGTVVVPVFNNSNDWVGPFFIYVEGAPGMKDIALSPGERMDVVFTNVADYGDKYQQDAIWATLEYRATYPGARADVIPGQTVRTGELVMTSSIGKIQGFRWPTYLPDGSRIATIYSEHYLYSIDPNGPAVGDSAEYIDYDFNLWGSALFWAPVPDLQDYFLYSSGKNDGSDDTVGDYIYLGKTDGSSYELLELDPQDDGNSLLGLTWLPDASGFLYSIKKSWMDWDTLIWWDVSNIYEYSFETEQSTQLTHVANKTYTRQITVSPDGSTILYEYQTSGDWYSGLKKIDLYRMNRDGSDSTLFVEDAQAPVWSQQDIPSGTNNPVPAPTNLNPSTKIKGQGAFTLTVGGSNFVKGSIVRWNGTALVTTFINSTTLTAQVPADKAATPGSVAITVFSPAPGGGLSQPLTLLITNTALKPSIFLPFLKR